MRAFDQDLQPQAEPGQLLNVFTYDSRSNVSGCVHLYVQVDQASSLHPLQPSEARQLAQWLNTAADTAERECAAANAALGHYLAATGSAFGLPDSPAIPHPITYPFHHRQEAA